MRVSDYYELGRTQPSLDFVDVNIYEDAKLYIDPRALRLLQTPWAEECVALVQDFFQTIVNHIKNGQNIRARELLSMLREPNETHLGESKGQSRGRGLGKDSARDVWESLSRSEAVKSGLLENLEDSILMIPGIGPDIISDITTNIIREPLIRYTQETCAFHSIPITSEVASGPLWDPLKSEWRDGFTALPIAENSKLLLVPKAIVRKKLDYDGDEYFRHYILEFLRREELASNSELVQLLKNGKSRVTKKDLVEKYGSGKLISVRETLSHPEILDMYRKAKRDTISPPLDHFDLLDHSDARPNWENLLSTVINLDAGREMAGKYENVIEQLLSALFYPSLTNPKLQHEIHNGRKRIDISYSNVAKAGFFGWLSQHYKAPYIFVECKNYSSDPANPELDQLAGRFSRDRGQFGLLICRKIENKTLFNQRCKDTTNDGRGYIIALDDDDLKALVDERRNELSLPQFGDLRERFDRLVM